MFQHLLVPVDDSDLSITNVGQAVKLARSFDPPAKVTFFHATADYAASDLGSRAKARMTDKLHRAPVWSEGSGLPVPELTAAEYRDRVLGQSRALLVKACAAAAAANVPFDNHSVVSDQPAEAIGQAAADCCCDLIVMASHGRSGLRALLTPSLTARVMRLSRVPLFITRTEAADPLAHASHATALIQDEHRSLAAVLHGMKRRVAEARSGAAVLDHGSFGRLLRYLHDYPEMRHHPKEEQSLHRLMRERGDRGRDVLHQLEGQHLREYELAARLQAAWADCGDGASGDDAQLARLDEALAALAGHVWEHMRLEEETLLPLALEVLTPGDWKEVAEVFEGNQDPGFGEWSEQDFRRHFTSAANVAKLPRAVLGAGA
jgi:nucleotide-binding universal stress UspA family protein/hemerythrin-like domain-containing protein